MPNLSQSADPLSNSWQILHQRWEQTRAVWNDPVAWSFEKEHWSPLEQQVRATQQDLERLKQVVAQAQRNVK